MQIEFWPQRWFYVGLIISGLTLAGYLGFLIFTGIHDFRHKRKGGGQLRQRIHRLMTARQKEIDPTSPR